MAQIIEENLLETIVKDDLKEFNNLMESAPCGSYRLGRFPVLSVLYLYNSRKILAVYEEKFIKTTTWEELREPASVAKAFSDRAGKCLRLYLNEVVSPLEMLLILDKNKRLKRVYPLTKASTAVKDRLQSIYSVKYSLNVEYKGNDIILDRRPLSRREKKKIAAICISSVLAVAIAVATPVTVLTLNPPLAKGEVKKIEQIDFNETTEYKLRNDITVPASYSGKKMKCSINGNGKKIVFEKGATVGEFSGKITDAEIVTDGSPVFSSLAAGAEISNVTFNVTADIETREGTALIALTSYGLIDGVTVNVTGKVAALTPDGVTEESGSFTELTFGGMVLKNLFKYNDRGNPVYGIIRNSTINYSNFTLEGETLANGVFAGIVGINSGAVGKCTVSGAATSDTFDLAGACSTNNGLLEEIINEADFSQTTSSDSWNPVVCGIVVENNDTVRYCENRGTLVSKSTCGQEELATVVSVAGIARYNGGEVAYCKNGGAVTAEGTCDIYAGGIAVDNVGQIGGCINGGAITVEGESEASVGGIVANNGNGVFYSVESGDISVKADKAYVGGIAGINNIVGQSLFSITLGYCSYCISEGNISVIAGDGNSRVGGIAGYIPQSSVVDGSNEDKVLGYIGGGASNCFFSGSISSNKGYRGSIAGVCGENLYYGTEPYYTNLVNFENNYHDNSIQAVGSLSTFDGDKKEEFKAAGECGWITVMTKEKMEQTEEYKLIWSTINNEISQ